MTIGDHRLRPENKREPPLQFIVETNSTSAKAPQTKILRTKYLSLFFVAQRPCHGNDHDRNREETISVHIVARNSSKKVVAEFWTRLVKNDGRNGLPLDAIIWHGKKANEASQLQNDRVEI
jgi:hypothetical protein